MNIAVSTGVDLIEIDRIGASLERFSHRFLERIYTDAEQQYCGNRVQRLAGRFAAKEAIGKALGVGIRGIRWRDLEVLVDHHRKPVVRLHGSAARMASDLGLTHFDVSISHSRTNAIAIVVAWGRSEL